MLVKHLLFVNGEMIPPDSYKITEADRKVTGVTLIWPAITERNRIWLVTPRLMMESGPAGGPWFEVTYFKAVGDFEAHPLTEDLETK